MNSDSATYLLNDHVGLDISPLDPHYLHLKNRNNVFFRADGLIKIDQFSYFLS